MAEIDVDNFRKWLSKKYESKDTVQYRINNCKRVAAYEGSLETHFQTEEGKGLMKRLTASIHDTTHHHKVPIKGDHRNGTATLKSAVKLYFEFLRSTKKK